MIALPQSWKLFLQSHPAAAAMDTAFPTLKTLFDQDKSIDDCTNAALGIEPSLFIICPSTTNQPTIVHHFSKAFRNALLADDTEEFFCLLGWGNTATPIKISLVTFFAAPGDGSVTNGGNRRSDFPGVDMAALRAAEDKESFAAGGETRPRVQIRKCVAIPPFVANWLMDMGSNDPHDWGVKIALETRSIEGNVNHPLHGVMTSEQGRSAIDRVLMWLFFSKSHDSLRLDCNPVFPGSKIDKITQNIHQIKLAPMHVAPAVEHPRNDRISEAMERTAAVLQELSENRREENEKSSSQEKGFNKLPCDIQSFLLAVGTQDLETPTDALPQTGLDLLKLSQKNAVTSLTRLLKKQGKRYVNLNLAHLNEITSINWFSSTNPFTGVSLCRIPPIAFGLLSNTNEKAQKLELLQQLELDKEEVLQTLTDKTLYKPQSIDDLIRNIEIVQGIFEIYVGAQSAIVQKILELAQEIKSFRMELEIQANADKDLLTKIQFNFDSRLNSWMERMYENADNLLDVPHSLVEFSSSIHNIFHGSFAVALPPSLLPAIQKKRPAADADAGEQPGSKREKTKKGVDNPSPNPDWKIKDNESWDMFTKDPNNLRPGSVCMMYHILGFCPIGTKCKRAKTHCKLTNETQIAQTNAFINDRRNCTRP